MDRGAAEVRVTTTHHTSQGQTAMRKLASTVAAAALAASVLIAPVVTAPAAHAAPGYSCHFKNAYQYAYLRTRDYSYAVQLTRYGWGCWAANY